MVGRGLEKKWTAEDWKNVTTNLQPSRFLKPVPYVSSDTHYWRTGLSGSQ